MTISDHQRKSIEQLAERYALAFGADEIPHRQCVRWAFATSIALRQYGFRSCVNAGSANFLLVAPEMDLDKSQNTNLEYRWGTTREDFEQWLSLGFLPEMHAWAVVPDENMIVDLTVRFRRQLAAECNIEFSMPELSSLWMTADAPQAGFSYEPNLDACDYAHIAFERLALCV